MTFGSNKNTTSTFSDRAQADFDSAHRKSSWRSVISLLTRQSNELLPYDQVLKLLPTKGQH
jgi:hypothetical protein